MAGNYPQWNDNKRDFWLRIASNLYDVAITKGVSGLNPPSWNDDSKDLQRKSAYYSAKIVENP